MVGGGEGRECKDETLERPLHRPILGLARLWKRCTVYGTFHQLMCGFPIDLSSI